MNGKKSYIYLWRSLMSTSFYKRPETCHLAIHLLLSAAWKNHDCLVGGKNVEIKRGQVLCGRNALSEQTGLSPQKIRTCLLHLKNSGFLTKKSTNKYSIITILNYSKYQPTEPDNQPSNQPATNQQPTSNQPQQNKGNKGNKTNTPPSPPGVSPEKIERLYHEILPTLADAKLDTTLRKQIKARCNEQKDRKKAEWWEWYFRGVKECDFLMGKNTDFAATLFWLTGPRNMSKVLNGQYLNRKAPATNQTGGRPLSAFERSRNSALEQARMLKAMREKEEQEREKQDFSNSCERTISIEYDPTGSDRE